MQKVLTVSEITKQIKQVVEENFTGVKIIGEISNFKAHVSGHWYFTLKDGEAAINCTMWRGVNNYVFFTPQNGMKVILSGRITVYPPRGSYQFDARSMQPAGVGELQKAFEELKRKLQSEGLFDEEIKKDIVEFPNTIGVVTGSDTAAFKDILSVASRRYPLLKIIIAPTKVQGDGAAEEIVNSIKVLNKRKDIDTIIVSRGGGSLEDLWAFNEEIVARAIHNSKIPVISGIGHEIDFTIADFVSDLRAPTPSAAMELATPNKDEILAFISNFSFDAKNQISDFINDLRNEVEQVTESYGFKNLMSNINNKKQLLDNYLFRIQTVISNFLNEKKSNLGLSTKIVSSNNIEVILKKGYVLVEQNNKYVKRKSEIEAKQKISLQFSDGKIELNK
ncbi:MAG: exodeoxyribonuclease VII large subunit [Ignavibacteriae bacterium]|nr:exodeoxyribonuclease VII large subunit [Ignavibacteriota bacterium]